MPTNIEIVCDNPSCPGNDLPTDNSQGWMYISVSPPGQMPVQYVYCSDDCAGTLGVALAAREAPDAS